MRDPNHSAVHKGVCKLLLRKGADALARLKTGEFPSQVCPKTPHGRALKYSLSRAERRAWRRLEKQFAELDMDEPPEPEDLADVDPALVEDLEAADGDDEDEDDGAAEDLDRDEREEL